MLPDDRTHDPDGGELLLRHSIGVRGNRVTERALTQQCYFRISCSEVRALDDLIDIASDLQDLVSIAINRTADIDALGFWHPSVYWQPTPEAKKSPKPVEYFVPWNARDTGPTPRGLQAHEMFFTYPDFGGIDGIGRWLRSAWRHRGGLGRVMASRYARQMLVSDRLLNRAAALEAFDREVTGFAGSKFKTRMKRCADLAGAPFAGLVGDIDAWAEVIRLDRDDIAHHFGRRMKHSSADQFFLAESLYWLFILCMLRDCQAPAKVYQRIADHQALDWLGHRVQSAVQNRR